LRPVEAEDLIGLIHSKAADAVVKVTNPRPTRIYAEVKPGCHREVIDQLLEGFDGLGISTITGVHDRNQIELNYHLRCGGNILTLRTRVPTSEPKIETITDLMPGAILYEREVKDLLGVEFTGLVETERLQLPDGWPKGVYPLRKDCNLDEVSLQTNGGQALEGSNNEETLSELGNIEVVFGPQHPALHEPEKFLFEVDGERVIDIKPRLGYAHRGIEKATEARTLLQDIYLVERICGICNSAHTLCFCQAVEDIADIRVPDRARYLRVIAAELNRIHSHMLLLGSAGLELGLESLFMYVWRDRERVMDALERLTGNRVISALNTFGGTRRDLSPDVAKSILKDLSELRKRMSYYRKVFEEDPTLRLRTLGIGVLSRASSVRLSAVGPVARASGVEFDVRKDDPYAAYGEIPFEIVTFKEGDVYSRLRARVEEVFESIGIVEYAIAHLPSGPYRVRVSRTQPPGEAVCRVEAPRGEDVHYVKTNGTAYPERVKVRSPTLANIASLCTMLRGCFVADIPSILVSIDPCFSCTDRLAFLNVQNGERWSLRADQVSRLRGGRDGR